MAKAMNRMTILSFCGTVLMTLLFRIFGSGLYLTLAITFGTTFYHLGMRLLVGLIYGVTMRNRADYTRRWYQIRPWEQKLYQFLKVKSWKSKMPAYRPETFSREKHSWDEIAQAMCQAELVHETNVILSFAPVICSVWLGEFWVFFITSVGGALFDLMFAVMQRYNRPRVVKAVLRQKGRQRGAKTV